MGKLYYLIFGMLSGVLIGVFLVTIFIPPLTKPFSQAPQVSQTEGPVSTTTLPFIPPLELRRGYPEFFLEGRVAEINKTDEIPISLVVQARIDKIFVNPPSATKLATVLVDKNTKVFIYNPKEKKEIIGSITDIKVNDDVLISTINSNREVLTEKFNSAYTIKKILPSPLPIEGQ